MNIRSCEKKENNIAELLVEVSAEEFDNAVNEAFRKNKNRISVPGFRKGKASRKMIERVYGASVFHSDALDILLPDAAEYVTNNSDMKLVGYPQVIDFDIDEEAGGAVFTLVAAVYPEITLGIYKGLSAVKPETEVKDSEVDDEVASVRLRNSRIDKVDRPAESGDIAVVDYEGFIDGEPFEGGKDSGYELELGSGSFIPGFEDGVIGMSAGEEKDLELVFPEQYADHLAGKATVFKVKLIEVKEKQLPELDDEFAKDVSEFDTLDEYKADIKATLLKTKQTDADSAFENALIDKLVESFEVDIPDVMVEEQMDIAMQNFSRQAQAYGMDPATYLKLMNTTPEVFRENSRASSEKQVKAILALEKIAELEGIEISEEELETEINEISERYGMEIEKIKETASEERIISDIKLRRAVKIITDNAVAEEPGSSDDKKADKTPAKAKKPAAKKPAVKKPDLSDEAEIADISPDPEPVNTEVAEADKEDTET